MSQVIDVESHGLDADRIEHERPLRTRWYDRPRQYVHERTPHLVLVTGVVLFAVLFLWPQIFISIHSGEAGVLWRRFGGGTQTDRVLGEGLKIVPPWNKLFIYNVRVQEVKHSMTVLTNEGLAVTLELSIRYHPEIDTVGLLHQQVGPNYRDAVVIPEVESSMRTAMASLPLRDVYGSERELVQRIINESLDHISQKFIRVDEIVLREVKLPAKLRESIETKLTEKETAEAYEYRLDIARKEAQRREIEATGLKTYNDVLNTSLTPNVLRWEGIQATRELAKSPNSKTIIIGNKDSGLPLIMGSEK